MKRSVAILVAAAVASMGFSVPAFSQGAPQTVSLIRVDLKPLASGYRTSKVIGGDVVNEANEKVGKIDDLIVTNNEKVPFAVLSVGGFLGVGEKLIVVPFNSIQVSEKRMLLPGASKEALKSLPEFKYSKS